MNQQNEPTNQFFLKGTIGGSVEVKTSKNGNPYCSFMIATKETFKTKEGQMSERATWHIVKAFGKVAKVCENYSKGDEVKVKGKISKSSFEKDGAREWSTNFIIHKIGHSQI